MNEFFLLLFELFVKLWGNIEAIISPLLNLIINAAEFIIPVLIEIVEFIFGILEYVVDLFKSVIEFFTGQNFGDFTGGGHGGGGGGFN